MTDTRESITAKLCSFARAYHSNYVKNKIFDDYLAYDIMGKDEYEEIGSLIYHNFDISKINIERSFKREEVSEKLNEYIIPIPLARIRYAEDKLLKFSRKHNDCQYVICGAGVDTFAFRNSNQNIKIFEIDHPATQKYKLQRISELEWNKPDNVNYVPVDFEKDSINDELLESGFDTSKKTFFSILGVSYYLTLSVFEETIKNISEISDTDSMIVFDYPDETTHSDAITDLRFQLLSNVTSLIGETMQQGFSYDSLKSVLSKYNFEINEHMTSDKIQSLYFDGHKENYRAFKNVHIISAIKTNKEN